MCPVRTYISNFGITFDIEAMKMANIGGLASCYRDIWCSMNVDFFNLPNERPNTKTGFTLLRFEIIQKNSVRNMANSELF